MMQMVEKNIKIRRIYFQVKVDDLDRAKDFYHNIFDFPIAWYESPAVGWCEIQLPGDARLGLNLRRKEDKHPPSWGILTIEVENLEATREILIEKGVQTTEIFDNPNYVSYFNIKDSEGNSIQIVGDPRIKE